MEKEFEELDKLDYESKLTKLMREPGKIHKSLQEECFTEIGKRQVSVSPMDCLYLLSGDQVNSK